MCSSDLKLARVLETTEKNVRNWESGRIYPSWPHYVRMCLAFGWPLPYGGGEPQEQATPPFLAGKRSPSPHRPDNPVLRPTQAPLVAALR